MRDTHKITYPLSNHCLVSLWKCVDIWLKLTDLNHLLISEEQQQDHALLNPDEGNTIFY